MSEYLTLKWGTLKAWNVESEPGRDALKRYFSEPTSPSAMVVHDTQTQKQAICEIIDLIDGPITNDWTGDSMTKDEAKKYVMEYGK